MKIKTLILPLACFVSFGAAAKSYVNLGYGVSMSKSAEEVTFTNTTSSSIEQIVKPRESDDSFNVTIGIDSGPNTAIEFSYSSFRSETELDTFHPNTDASQNEIRSYSANLSRNQFSITPVYYKSVNNKMTVKGGLGLAYTQYEFTGHAENQIGASQEFPLMDVKASTRSTDKYGLIGVVGFDYSLLDGITVGAQANLTYDKLATNSALYATLGIRF